jgi:hypothetical protein
MKRIQLTKGKFAIVDDGDFEWLNQWKWFYASPGYAARDVGGRKDKQRVLMHRLLNKTKEGLVTDHINRDRLDNRKINLRSITNRQNLMNTGLKKNNKTGYIGVDWYKNRWVARIKVMYKGVYLGRFKKLEDAIIARKEGEERYAI